MQSKEPSQQAACGKGRVGWGSMGPLDTPTALGGAEANYA